LRIVTAKRARAVSVPAKNSTGDIGRRRLSTQSDSLGALMGCEGRALVGAVLLRSGNTEWRQQCWALR